MRMSRPRSFPAAARSLAVLPLAAALLAGCSSGPAQAGPAGSSTAAPTSAGPSSPPDTAAATNWPVYHLNAARTGLATGLPAAGRLSIAWTSKLDGAVYGQPLVIGGTVLAATENDSVYGLDRGTGRVRWRRHLGTPVPLSALPCGDIDPLGITGTPGYDPATGLVYVVAEETGYRHVLYGLTLTGQLKIDRALPTPDNRPRYDQQRPAITLAGGRVYVAFGGLDGDCGPYIGSVVSVPASGTGPVTSYRVPTSREGAIWGTGNLVAGPHGTLYASVGNGASTRGRYDGSDSVIGLSPALHRAGFFAPSTWAADNAGDLDLGSMSPALLGNGTILADGKRGTAYLLNAGQLGGIGGQLAKAPVCRAFGGPAVDGAVAYLPCADGGMAAVSTAGHRIRVLWRGPAAANGSPVLGGGAVWVPDWDSGMLYELSQATGRVRQHISLGGALPHFASPSLSGGLVLTGTMTGVTAVTGA
ncbi:MAG TPA: PQQ-binding-like beta-propeller repeat protein [Streptosporangiaceae bacterium]|jgi:outer membrane protein assembly factor BamB